MITNKGQVQINNLLVANQKHGIAKIKGCLIKGRPVTSRPLNCQKIQNVAESTDNSGSKIKGQRDEQRKYLNSTPYVGLIQESSLINACIMAKRSPPAPKTCTKSKQPIIRSYIIRQNHDLTPQSMFYNCNAEHNKFVNLLNQCINKRSLTSSKDQRKSKISPSQYNNNKEGRMLCQSFNNVKVKQSLSSIFLSQLDIVMSPRQALANSYIKHNLKRPHSQTKGQCKTNQLSQNGTAQNEDQRWKSDNEFYSDYTNITDYIIERNMTQKDSSVHNSLLASSNFATVNNYSNFCRLKYQRKKKESLKLSKNVYLQKQRNNNISKSHYLKDTSILHKGKYNGSCLNKKEKERQDEGNPEDKYNLDEDIKIQDFQIFTEVGSRTPPKRKISTSFYSPEKLIIGSPQKLSKQQKQKLSKTSIKKQRVMEGTQQCEQGNSCYLRTINF